MLLGNVTAAGNGTAGSPGTSREQIDADWLLCCNRPRSSLQSPPYCHGIVTCSSSGVHSFKRLSIFYFIWNRPKIEFEFSLVDETVGTTNISCWPIKIILFLEHFVLFLAFGRFIIYLFIYLFYFIFHLLCHSLYLNISWEHKPSDRIRVT